MSLWQTFTSHPAVAAVSDGLGRLLLKMELHASTTDPAVWMLLAFGAGAIWILAIARPR
jgi:hypothetical protein